MTELRGVQTSHLLRDRLALCLLVVLAATIVCAGIEAVFRLNGGFGHRAAMGGMLHLLNELRKFLPTLQMDDSWAPMKSALQILHGPNRSRLYETVFFQAHVKFQYPPTALLFVDALRRLRLARLSVLNLINCLLFILNIGAVILLFRRACARYMPQGSNLTPLQLGLFALAALLFYPALRALLLGQIQVWINLLLTLSCLCWLADRRALSGVLIGIATTLKPQWGLFLVWALLWRDWRFARGYLIGFIPLLAISIAAYGWHNHIEYLQVLAFLSRHGEAYFPNNSVNGLLNRLLRNGDNLNFDDHQFPPYNGFIAWSTLLTSLFLVAVALAPAVTRRARLPNIFDFGAVAIVATIASPIAWEHHYGVMLPLFAIGLARRLGQPSAREPDWLLIELVAAWALAANYLAFLNVFSATWLNILQSYLLFAGALLLGAFVALRGSADVALSARVAAAEPSAA